MAQDALTDLQLLNAPGAPLTFNETTYDRKRGNTNQTMFSSAARTTTVTPGISTNYNARGVRLVTDVTVASGTGGLTVQIQAVDTLSGKFITLLASAAITATGTYSLVLYPGVAVAANASANDVLPRNWRVNVAVGDASSYTYSISACLIV